MTTPRNPKDALTWLSPVYNERETLRELVERCRKVSNDLGCEFRMILVDDASTDGSREVLEEIAAETPGITILFLRAHYGKSAALSAGFAEVNSGWLVTLDSDLQDQPEELPKLLEASAAGIDLVSGHKIDRNDPLGKRIGSALFNWTASRVAGIRLHDCNSGFKLYRAELAQELMLDGSRHRVVMLLALWKGFRVAEVPVRHAARRAGKTKYGIFRSFAGFFDLCAILLVEKFRNRPVHFFGSIGVGFFIAGALSMAYILGQRILGYGWATDRPLFFIGILLMILGVNFFTTGMLAEFYNADRPRNPGQLIRQRLQAQQQSTVQADRESLDSGPVKAKTAAEEIHAR